MFADDTQLINKTEESIEETFKTLEIYVRLNTCFCIFEKHFYPAPETVTKAKFFKTQIYPPPQGCPIAPMLYILQAEPLATSIRRNPKIVGISLPNRNGPDIETKVNMFADDTQLINKNFYPAPETVTKAKFFKAQIYPPPLNSIERFLLI
jgi:hypothetical protein